MTKFRGFFGAWVGTAIVVTSLTLFGCSGVNKDYCYYTNSCADTGDVDLGTGGGDGDMRSSTNDDGGGGGDGGSDVDMRKAPPVDPDKAGPYRTAQFDLSIAVTGGTSYLTVIGPSDDGMTLTKRGAPFPVVVFSPGFTIDRRSYASYGQRLGSHGIVTVLQRVPADYDHARYRDNTVELITWLLAPSGMGADRIKGFVDEKRVGIAGHSLGGKIGLLVAAMDSRVKAYFGIDPVDSNSTPASAEVAKIKLPGGLPLALVGETVSKMGRTPCAPAEFNYEMLYGKASSPAFAITMPGVAHGDWVDNCTTLCTNYCPGGTAPRDRTRALTAKYITAYFLWGLGGDTEIHQYLDGAAFQKDVMAGYVTRVSK